VSQSKPWAAYPVKTSRYWRRGKVHAVYGKADTRPLCGIGTVRVPPYIRDVDNTGLFAQTSKDIRCTKCSIIVRRAAEALAERRKARTS
jgi:hypothetical protein